MRDVIDRDTFSEDEERLDRAARRLYGSERSGSVERLLAGNPGLAALAIAGGGYLPRGTLITVLPRPQPAPNPAFTRAWE